MQAAGEVGVLERELDGGGQPAGGAQRLHGEEEGLGGAVATLQARALYSLGSTGPEGES